MPAALEDVIHCMLATLLGITLPNEILHNSVALPPHRGGVEIFNPSVQCNQEYSASLDISGLLSCHIGSSQVFDYFDLRMEQLSRKSAVHLSKQS